MIWLVLDLIKRLLRFDPELLHDWHAVRRMKVVPRTLRTNGRVYDRYTIKGYYEDGKRYQGVFHGRMEAERLLWLLRLERLRFGKMASQIPLKFRTEYIQAAERLRKYGATPRQAVDWFLKNRKSL